VGPGLRGGAPERLAKKRLAGNRSGRVGLHGAVLESLVKKLLAGNRSGRAGLHGAALESLVKKLLSGHRPGRAGFQPALAGGRQWETGRQLRAGYLAIRRICDATVENAALMSAVVGATTQRPGASVVRYHGLGAPGSLLIAWSRGTLRGYGAFPRPTE
jgi:hypothetical protein